MLTELRVRDLGIIEELDLVLGPGLSVLSGETGAGKTLVVGALELLVGGRADPVVVRPGATEAWVEGRVVFGEGEGEAEREIVLARAVPVTGRSRAYIDGRAATAATLAGVGRQVVDLHGQHTHQSLLSPAVQRAALDRFAGVDLGPLREARDEIGRIDRRLAALGGDEQARAREIDLLRYQVDELTRAGIAGEDEDDALAAEEDVLADAAAHREAAMAALEALSGDGGALDALGVAIAALGGRAPFVEVEARLRGAAAEVADLAGEARVVAERIAEDPERLEVLRARRQLLAELRRKYGPSLADVIEFGARAQARLAELTGHELRAAELERALATARRVESEAAAEVAAARRAAAPRLAAAVQEHLEYLAMPGARVEVRVEGDGPADDVDMLLGANPGAPALPLGKAASGGELARAMLALRLVLSAGPPTLVFDEVDAGIGGEAAVAVGRSLAALAADRQVLVVTHLPQVAAFADAHLRVAKHVEAGRTVSTVEVLDDEARVVELSRMLSGRPASATARRHASELLSAALAGRERAWR